MTIANLSNYKSTTTKSIIPLDEKSKKDINNIPLQALETIFDILRVRFIIEAGEIVALEI